MKDLAAVIVSFNVRDELLGCIRSLRADGVEEIVVVDNASADGSAAAAQAADPDVKVLALARNLGFGGGANRGVASTSAPYVAILNPDLVVEPGAAKALVGALEGDPGLGLVGPRIETPEGEIYPSARRFPSLVDAAGHAFLWFLWPSNPFTRRYRMTDWGHTDATDVDWVAGTHMVVRREAWDAVGGFDEGYFMYGEDVDLCWRLWKEGWRVGFVPDARVVHAIGRSTDQTPYRMIAHHHRSLWRFSRKTAAGWERPLLPAIGLALLVRTALAWLQRATRRKPHAAL